MVSPSAVEDEETQSTDSPLDNEWTEDDGDVEDEEDDEETEEITTESGKELATADVHDESFTTDDNIGGVDDDPNNDLSEAEIDDDPDVETAEVDEEDLSSDSGSFGFDDVEDDEEESDEDEEEEEDEGVFGGLEDGGQMAEDINRGVAHLGTVGLDDEETQEELREDFYGTAQAFRLGYYGEECMQEYVLTEGDEEISPVWGLVFAALICGAIFVMRRPDSDEITEKLRDQVENIGGGG